MRGGPAARPCAISSAGPIPCVGHEPELARGGRVPAPGDEHGAEPLDRGLAGGPLGEREQRVARAARAVGLDRAIVRSGQLLGFGEILGIARAARARRLEERAERLLRRVRKPLGEAAEEDRRAALVDRELVAPQAEREAEGQVRGRHRVRSLAREHRGRVRHADADHVEPLLEPRRLRLDAAQESLGVGDRGRPGEDGCGRQLAGQAAEHATAHGPGHEPEQPPEREVRDAVDGLTVVRVAVEDTSERGRVQRERDSEQGDALGQSTFEPERETPAARNPRSRAGSRRSPCAAPAGRRPRAAQPLRR